MITIDGLSRNGRICCIYGIRDIIDNNIVAIGQTKNYYERMTKYRSRINDGGLYKSGDSNKWIYRVIALEPDRYVNEVLCELPRNTDRQTRYNIERALQIAYGTIGGGYDCQRKCWQSREQDNSGKGRIKRYGAVIRDCPDAIDAELSQAIIDRWTQREIDLINIQAELVGATDLTD